MTSSSPQIRPNHQAPNTKAIWTIAALAILGLVLIWPWYLWRERLFGEASVNESWPTEGYSLSCAKYVIALTKLRLYTAQAHLPSAEEQVRQSKALAEDWRDILTVQMDTIKSLHPSGTLSTKNQEVAASIHELDAAHSAVVQTLPAAWQSIDNYHHFLKASETANSVANDLLNQMYMVDSQYFDDAIDSRNAALRRVFDLGSGALVVAVAMLLFAIHSLRVRRRSLLVQAEAFAEMQRTAHARSLLLGMVSHELRTPMQTLSSTTEVLEMLDRNGDLAQHLERANAAIAVMAQSLKTLAQYARLTTDDPSAFLGSFRLADLISKVAKPYIERQQETGHQIVIRPIAAIYPVISDQSRLHQVLDNYISNAIKYSPPGKVDVVATVEDVVDDPHGVVITIEVLDDGPGVSQGDAQKIWDSYYRAQSSAASVQGTGLGLSVVTLLAKSVGWDVGYRRTSDGRTCFFVTFKAKREMPSVAQNPRWTL